MSQERSILLAIFCVALLHGLIYVFLVPPWGHYDEPAHFEYGWWIANRLRLPQERDVDRGMRREVAASMLEHGFYRDLDVRPDLLPQPDPIPLGVSEFDHPPAYYALIALPLRVLRHTDVALQLYLGRSVSLLLYLASIGIAYGLLQEWVPPGHSMRWAVPAAMALLPGYVDLMTAVNNDAGAVVALSFFLWGAVRAIVRGPTPARVAWILASAALCAVTKNTAALAILLAPLALVLAGRRPVPLRWAAALLLGGGVLAAALVLGGGDAAQWIRFTPQRAPTSRPVAQAPAGARALALDFTPDLGERDGIARDAALYQLLPQDDVQALQGLTVTLSAYIWASQPASVDAPALSDGVQRAARRVEVDETPVLHVLTATVAPDARQVQVIVRPMPSWDGAGAPASESDAAAWTVFYDQVTLVEESGLGPNRVRNGSAERTWPRIRPIVDEWVKRYTRRSPSQFLASLLDGRRTAHIYKLAATNLFQSFWARFGWNQIELASGWYWAAGALTLSSGIGALIGWTRLPRLAARAQRVVGLLLAAALLVWLNALLRVHPVGVYTVIPAARYAYPAVIPSLLALVAGWQGLVPRRHRGWWTGLMLALLLVLDVASIWTLNAFYYRR